ncbi:MAG: hypothetical protein ABSE05_15075 [Syntrophales bacterium]
MISDNDKVNLSADKQLPRQESVDENKKKKRRIKSKARQKIPHGIIKLTLEAFSNDPYAFLQSSPELFRVLSELDINKGKINKYYFDNYITEREYADLLSQITPITQKDLFSREEAIRLLELTAAIGLNNDLQFRPIVLKAAQCLGLDMNEEKDITRLIRKGEIAHRAEVVRGLLLSFDWSGSLLEVSLLGKDNKIRNAAEKLIGCVSIADKLFPCDQDCRLPHYDKIITLDKSAFFSILDTNATNFKMLSSEFLKLIDSRVVIVCPAEVLFSVISYVRKVSGASIAEDILKNSKNVFRLICTLPKLKKLIFSVMFYEACEGLDISSLYAVLFARMSGTPLLASDYAVINAYEKMSDIEERLFPQETISQK